MDDESTAYDAKTFDREVPEHEIPGLPAEAELDDAPLTLELEADEPPDGAELQLR